MTRTKLARAYVKLTRRIEALEAQPYSDALGRIHDDLCNRRWVVQSALNWSM